MTYEVGLRFAANGDRKQMGSGWCIGPAHSPAVLSSEQSHSKAPPHENADVGDWSAQVFACVANQRIREFICRMQT